MAIREKTIEYAFPMTTGTVADATVTNLTQITIEVPESSPTFISVFAEIGFQDIITATGGRIAEYRVGLRLGAAGYTTITELDDVDATGENLAGIFGPYNFTSHFTTNWTGTSMTCDLQVYFDQDTGTTLGMTNVTGKLYITYTYDDTAATQIKTVRIPLESLTGALPTTATNFGTDQIPQLTGTGGFLPENSPVIVDYFFEITGNEANNAGTTDFVISCNIDGGTATAFGTQVATLASDRFCRWIYKPGSVPTTTATHNLQMWISTGGVTRVNHAVVTLVVTYKFTLSGTTRTVNSLVLPWEMPSPLGDAADGVSTFVRSIIVSEPGTITLKQSAFTFHWNSGSGGNVEWKVGAQAYRLYTNVASVVCGGFCLQQRFDSGSAQGAGMTLAFGENEIILDADNVSSIKTNVSGRIILNYESDVPSQGIGAAAHTVMSLIEQFDAARSTGGRWVTGVSFPISTSNYYLVESGFYLPWFNYENTTGLNVNLSYETGEGPASGWANAYADTLTSDAEAGSSLIYVRARDLFKRFPQDADTTRLDIETSRTLSVYVSSPVSPGTASWGSCWLVTLHHCTFTVADSISGNDVALPTTVRLHLASNDEVFQEQVLSAGTTSFSFTVYDQRDYYVSAYQDDTHVGRSGISTPT
jgi:hypothetical protein